MSKVIYMLMSSVDEYDSCGHEYILASFDKNELLPIQRAREAAHEVRYALGQKFKEFRDEYITNHPMFEIEPASAETDEWNAEQWWEAYDAAVVAEFGPDYESQMDTERLVFEIVEVPFV